MRLSLLCGFLGGIHSYTSFAVSALVFNFQSELVAKVYIEGLDDHFGCVYLDYRKGYSIYTESVEIVEFKLAPRGASRPKVFRAHTFRYKKHDLCDLREH